MATTASLQSFFEEATCSVCLDYFHEPVTIECGHNFCQGCLGRYWERLPGEEDVPCPQCRVKVRRSRFPNWQLGNISKKIRLEERASAEGKGGVCGKHEEPLKLFCKDDEAPICVVCDKSKEHRGHQVVPLEEAAEDYKDLICGRLELLKEKRSKIIEYSAKKEKESEELLVQANAERQQLVAKFQEVHRVMEKKKCDLLARLQELDKSILKHREEHSGKMTAESTSLKALIQEIEDKCQLPTCEFLQDMKSILQRCEVEEPQVPAAFPPEIKKQIQEFSDINDFLKRVMNPFQDALLTEHQLCKEAVMLDPATAHPELSVSEDRKVVKLQFTREDLPDTPERFDFCTCVLGSKGFCTGSHWWEVEVGERGVWAAGVALASVKRKGPVSFNPDEGIWAVGQFPGGHYQALATSKHRLLLKQKPRMIRVTVNYEKEQVAFLNAETQSPIFGFSSALFKGEEIFPWFWVGGLATKLRLML